MDVYPLEVSLAWVILKYISFILALLISVAFSLPAFITVLLIPTILLSLDFIIDPLAVHKTKLWHWQRGSKYFGIPVQNFIGWYLVGLIATLMYSQVGYIDIISFHPIHILPLVLYASFLNKVPHLIRLDSRMGILGSLPTVIWTLLGATSLYMLFPKIL